MASDTKKAVKRSRIRPDYPAISRKNGEPKRIFLTSGLTSKRAAWGQWDRRCLPEQARQHFATEYVQHLGGVDNVSAVQIDLIDMAARLKVLANLAYTQLLETGVFNKDGDTRPLVDGYRRLEADRRELLKTLGIERHAKSITLPDILAGRANLPEDEE